MKYLTVLLFCLFTNTLFSQTLTGKVIDAETGEDLIGANIVVQKEGVFIAGCATDWDGNYSLKLEHEGIYDLEVSYIGFPHKLIKNVAIMIKSPSVLNVGMDGAVELTCWYPYTPAYKIPVYERDNPNTINTISAEQIRQSPNKSVKGLIGTMPVISSGF